MAFRQPKEILGFQFEPERNNPRIIRDNAPGSDSDSSWEDFEGVTGELMLDLAFYSAKIRVVGYKSL